MKVTDNPVWEEDLIMCPSQCECHFETKSGQRFCIYMRWRWDDPWTAQLVPTTDTGVYINYAPWEYLDVPDFIHDGYKNLERLCVRMIEDRFGEVKWLKR